MGCGGKAADTSDTGGEDVTVDSDPEDTGDTDTDTEDTDDTDPPTGDILESWDAGCIEDEMFVSGFASVEPASAVYNIFDTKYTKDWDEEGPMTISVVTHGVAVGVSQLVTGAAVGDWSGGTNTVFTCDQYQDDGLTYAIRLYDADGNLLDCVAWSGDPSVLYDGGTSTDRTTAAAELTEANCAK